MVDNQTQTRSNELRESYLLTEDAFSRGIIEQGAFGASLVYTILLHDLPSGTLDIEPPTKQLADLDALTTRVNEVKEEFLKWAGAEYGEAVSEDPTISAKATIELAKLRNVLDDADLVAKVRKEGEAFLASMSNYTEAERMASVKLGLPPSAIRDLGIDTTALFPQES